jgi:hypothetical protein
LDEAAGSADDDDQADEQWRAEAAGEDGEQ